MNEVETMQPSEKTLQDVLTEFRETLQAVHPKLQALTEELADAPWAQGKWTRKQVMGHLIDSAATNHQRFVRGQLSTHAVIPGYHPDAWVEVQKYHLLPWNTILDLWYAYNQHLLGIASQIPPERLSNVIQIAGETFEAPLEWWVTDYVRHLRHHLGQVFTGLDADEAPTG
ncbi:DinB family protein [Deinococcus roseus]|uniref:DinB-like domain-containing protein n=1 Tax=Deinococcus roseus TaxID=392414 RepID=A0ABQ2D025_9DEIO|nr:DinB family protein [Deinococcus roseus]GGJ33289.1 hypothetical protein GCM10008938_19460 [Deinococcus roseus]